MKQPTRQMLQAQLDQARTEADHYQSAYEDATAALGIAEQKLGAANRLLEQVRIQVSPHYLDAFKPKTEDQATNAGRFAVAFYVLEQIHAIVFGDARRPA